MRRTLARTARREREPARELRAGPPRPRRSGCRRGQTSEPSTSPLRVSTACTPQTAAVEVEARARTGGSAGSRARCRRSATSPRKREPARPARQARDGLEAAVRRRRRPRRSRELSTQSSPAVQAGRVRPREARARPARASRRRRSRRGRRPGSCGGPAGAPTIRSADAEKNERRERRPGRDRVELEVVAARSRARRRVSIACGHQTRSWPPLAVEPDDRVLADGVPVQRAADEREVVQVERAGMERACATGTSSGRPPSAVGRPQARPDLVGVARARDVTRCVRSTASPDGCGSAHVASRGRRVREATTRCSYSRVTSSADAPRAPPRSAPRTRVRSSSVDVRRPPRALTTCAGRATRRRARPVPARVGYRCSRLHPPARPGTCRTAEP